MIIKLLKTKDRQILKATRDDTLVMGKNNSNDIRFLIRNYGDQKQMVSSFQMKKTKDYQNRI